MNEMKQQQQQQQKENYIYNGTLFKPSIIHTVMYLKYLSFVNKPNSRTEEKKEQKTNNEKQADKRATCNINQIGVS